MNLKSYFSSKFCQRCFIGLHDDRQLRQRRQLHLQPTGQLAAHRSAGRRSAGHLRRHHRLGPRSRGHCLGIVPWTVQWIVLRSEIWKSRSSGFL